MEKVQISANLPKEISKFYIQELLPRKIHQPRLSTISEKKKGSFLYRHRRHHGWQNHCKKEV